MKSIAALLITAIVICGSAAGQAVPIVKKADGTVLINPQVVGFDGEFFSVAHQDGIAKIRFDSMPEQMRGTAVFSPGAADAARKKIETDLLKREAALRASFQSKWNVRSIEQVWANNALAYHGRPYVLRGRIKASGINIAPAKQLNETWSFTIGEGERFARAYAWKTGERIAELHSLLLEKWDGVDGYFLVTGVSSTAEHALPLACLYDWCTADEFEKGSMAQEWYAKYLGWLAPQDLR